MPIALICPNCNAQLSKTAFLSDALVCDYCGAVIVQIGGTLGLTSAYGVSDPTISRERAQADLAVLCKHRDNSVGMLEASKEQLKWGVERYAKLPNPPQFLFLVPVPSFWKDFCGDWEGTKKGCLFPLLSLFTVFAVYASLHLRNRPDLSEIIGWPLILGAWAVFLWHYWFGPYYDANSKNGERPQENARRQRAYEESCAAAMMAAEPVKAAQDHRLRCDIRKLEGTITTLSEKAEDVRRILRTL